MLHLCNLLQNVAPVEQSFVMLEAGNKFFQSFSMLFQNL